ncbi:uncharacterized protein LOC116297689 [Actinia tenebrosa]|uniref:Uncharacterized protein LOC116297689 n=1 Tax=Actinia tenebrosa TaxID=6105 RepID=A0A6P8HZM2_ACTTE|nr:uncharacterized protein LOC116297689 [Actinia tenebrosa]
MSFYLSFGISPGKLDVFVILTSNEGKEYLLSPVNDAGYGDWLTNLKNKINGRNSPSPFERSSPGQKGFMSRVRNSLRRKKKLGRSMSEDVTGQTWHSKFRQERDEASYHLSTPETKHKTRENITNELRKERSHSYPSESEDDERNDVNKTTLKVKTYEDKACDTSSLVCLDWIITDGGEDTADDKHTNEPNVDETRQNPRKLLKAVGIDYDLEGQTDSNQKGNTVLVNQSIGQGLYSVMDSMEGQTDIIQKEVTVPVNQSLHGFTDLRQTDIQEGNVSPVNQGLQGQTDSTKREVSLPGNLCTAGQTDSAQREIYLPVNQNITGQTDTIKKKDKLPVSQSLPGQTDSTSAEVTLTINQSSTGQTDTIKKKDKLPVSQSLPGQTDSTSAEVTLTINQSSTGQTDTTHGETYSSRDGESISETGQVDVDKAALVERKNTPCSYKLCTNVHNDDFKADMSLQQQKIIRELEIEVCKLKCEVISLIQGTIKVPLKDDDLADWHYVEEIRYKDRIFELLREARLYNPSLPDLDSSKSSNFKDVYGFIHGSRESESVVFHFVCRELTQHYSSFFQVTMNDDCQLNFVCEKVDSVKAIKGVNFYKNQVRKIVEKKQKSEMSEVERQIRCDLLRTMPSNVRFKTLESEEVTQLKRILHVFADVRPDIGYLQVSITNVSLFIVFFSRSLYAVVDVYLRNYFDRMLSGVQADQEVLKELVAEKLPALHAHLKYYGVDISTVTFNWFITVYLDAVPFETAVRIWDSFLFEGREVLFRIAIGLLKLQERSLLQLSGHLEIMQYMKRAARVMYDVDRLFKASFEEMTKFPTNEMLDEKQKQYRADIKSKLGHVSPIKHETSRSRVSSFTVELPSQDKVDRFDQYQMVECAVATSKDLSGPVCISCSVRGEAKVYLLDINKKEMSTLDAHINSRILCTDVLEDGTVLIGTVFWCVYAFNIESRMELWSVPLRDSVIDLCHYDHVTDDKVYAALADGCIAVLPNANGSGPPCQGSHVRIGSAPVMCVTMVDSQVWCGCGNNVVVLDASSLEELHATVVSSSPRHQVARLLEGNHGVWCTIRGSSWVMLIDQNSYDFLLKIDVALDTTIIDAVSESQVYVSPFQESRVTTIMPFADELWVGLGNGQVLIFDLIESETPSKEGDLVESCDSNDEDTPTASTEEEEEEIPNDKSKSQTASNPRFSREGTEVFDKASSEYQFSLKMRVQYRVSEEPIRSLEILRETEDPMVLSCASTLSPEGGLSIWQKHATQDDLYEWLNYPIRHSQA